LNVGPLSSRRQQIDTDRIERLIRWAAVTLVIVGLFVVLALPGIYQIVEGRSYSRRSFHLQGDSARLEGIANVLLWALMPAYWWLLNTKGTRKRLLAGCMAVIGISAVVAFVTSFRV
jgi:hypothetical protein